MLSHDLSVSSTSRGLSVGWAYVKSPDRGGGFGKEVLADVAVEEDEAAEELDSGMGSMTAMVIPTDVITRSGNGDGDGEEGVEITSVEVIDFLQKKNKALKRSQNFDFLPNAQLVRLPMFQLGNVSRPLNARTCRATQDMKQISECHSQKPGLS